MAPQVKFVFSGNLQGTQGFSCQLHFKLLGVGGVGQSDLDTWLASVHTLFTTYAASAGGSQQWLGLASSINLLKAYYMPAPNTPAEHHQRHRWVELHQRGGRVEPHAVLRGALAPVHEPFPSRPRPRVHPVHRRTCVVPEWQDLERPL